MSNDILWRVYLVYLLILLAGLIIIGKVVYIQFFEGSEWIEKAQEERIRYDDIDANRGNIYDANGKLIATSVPIFDIRMDVSSPLISDELFTRNIDSLALQLSRLFNNKSKQEYKHDLVDARTSGNRYLLIKRNVTYEQLKTLRTFPILRKGKYKGGLIAIRKYRRELPFRFLASRTIGFSTKDYKVGLEGTYDSILRGIGGKRLMQKITNNNWVPVNNENEIEPQDGKDVISTIDINIQDVAQDALLRQLITHNADHGCAVLMEVSTGEIKAIANLGKNKNGRYEEIYNYAVGEKSEPGSTFKLPALVAAMDIAGVKRTDIVNTGDGKIKYYDVEMVDNKVGGYGAISIQNAFEVSSLVGISKVIHANFHKNPQKFIDKLFDMGLGSPTGIEISGEPQPYIKRPSDPSWSGITIPWMANGYELELTPLQILTFYNAIANNGKMVKPRLTKEIRENGQVIEKNNTEVMVSSICSESTLEQAQKMLEAVVANGTAKNLSNPVYSIAGKTGTAQLAKGSAGYNKEDYKASFVGYFPADNPTYSCIVVINDPSNGVYYGSLVAGPVFREIADKVYAANLIETTKHKTSQNRKNELTPIISSEFIHLKDAASCFSLFNIKGLSDTLQADWYSINTDQDSIILKTRKISKNTIPDFSGLKAKDAISLAGELRLKPQIRGKGEVKHQSIKPGTAIKNGQKIVFELEI